MRIVDQSANESGPEVNGADTADRAAPLDRRAIGAITSSGKRLIVQGAMGIHASDGLAGRVAANQHQFFLAGGIAHPAGLGQGLQEAHAAHHVDRAGALNFAADVHSLAGEAAHGHDHVGLPHMRCQLRANVLAQRAGRASGGLNVLKERYRDLAVWAHG